MNRTTLAIPLALAALALADTGPTFMALQSQAMGRTGVASSHGPTALFLNPAGLGGDEGGNMGISADMGLNAVLLDYADWAHKHSAYIGNMDSMATRMEEVDTKWAPFTNSFLIKGSYQDIAFALLNDSRYDLTISRAVVTPVLGVYALSDLVLTAGRGIKGPEGYNFGVSFKYIYRLSYERKLVGWGDEDIYRLYNEFRKPGKGIADMYRKLQVAGDIAETQQGVGMNLGVEKNVGDDWTAGMSLIDFPTIIDARFARPDLNVGMAYHKKVQWLEGLDNRILVNADIHRFLTPGTPWWRQFKLGAAFEGYVGKRQVAYIATGMNDGYPTFGARLGYIAYLSYVYVAEEVGTYPGQEKLSFHKLVVEIDI